MPAGGIGRSCAGTIEDRTSKKRHEKDRDKPGGGYGLEHARTFPPGKGPPAPRMGKVPVFNMILHWGKDNQHQAVVRTLLDSGSSIPLLSFLLAKQMTIPTVRRTIKKDIGNFNGETVKGAGLYYTFPLLLQYKHHFTTESFEIGPMANEYDAILPDWWIEKHKPEYTRSQISFTLEHCRRECTRAACAEFSLEWDDEVPTDPDACLLGVVCAAPTEKDLKEAIDRVPEIFKEYMTIMTTEAALMLPEHGPYDHTIDLKEGEVPPRGPI
jgi:hypothetical protein